MPTQQHHGSTRGGGQGQYEHAEAFCLMKYQERGGTKEEIIWNSRDGVTPFGLPLRSGEVAFHVEWDKDKCDPDHKPKKGDRIFVDYTDERKQQAAEAFRNKCVKNVEEGHSSWPIPSMEDILEQMFPPGAPDLIEVEEDWQ